MYQEQKSGPSWAVVIIVLAVFWPVGLFLLWRKLGSDKKAPLRNSKALFALGCLLVFVGIMGFFSALGSRYFFSQMTQVIFYCGGGAALIYMSKKMKLKGEKFKAYIALVANQHIYSIDSIASAMRLDPSQVMDDLNEMIKKGYFGNARIDYSIREIVFPAPVSYAPPATAYAQQPPQQRVATCGSCGANNTVLGAVGECEFCGSPLA